MTAITRLVVTTVHCDRTNCPNTIVPTTECSPNSDRLAALIYDRMWSTWEGHGVRHYCPKHKPQKLTGMYPIDPPSDRDDR